MSPTTIWLRRDAPAKPAPGERCNGCGVCCASAPCPVGMLVSRRRVGRCRALVWHAPQRRYRCGLVPSPRADAPPLPLARRLQAWLVRRWIGAGAGCDSYCVTEPH